MSDPICYVVRGTDEENDPIEESYPILDLATEAWGAYYSAHAERVEIIAVAEDGTETPLPSYEGALRERDALAATVERLIREAGAIRADERKRAEDEHKALDDEGRQRDANRIERLEGEVAKLRRLVDDADKAKAEHEATRDELRRLHDVLSGKRELIDEAAVNAHRATQPPLLRCDGACGYSCRLSHIKPGTPCPNEDGTLRAEVST